MPQIQIAPSGIGEHPDKHYTRQVSLVRSRGRGPYSFTHLARLLCLAMSTEDKGFFMLMYLKRRQI